MSVYVFAYSSRGVDLSVPVSTTFKIGQTSYCGTQRLHQEQGPFSIFWEVLINARVALRKDGRRFGRKPRDYHRVNCERDVESELIQYLNKHPETRRMPYGGDYYFGWPDIAVSFLRNHKAYIGELCEEKFEDIPSREPGEDF